MPELDDGETAEVKGSAKDPYILKNTGGVYSCSCPAWRNQSVAIEIRTCKHLRQYLGEDFEKARLGGELPSRSVVRTKPAKAASSDGQGESPEPEESGPGFLLAHSWTGDVDMRGWWMSEKLDGVRAYWDGSKFISRQGNEYMAPDWFVEALPKDIHLDGELWLARKAFQRAVSIVRRQDKNKDWKEIKFVVFDAPQVDDIFEARIAFVQQLLDDLRSDYAEPHLHIRCNGEEHLREELARVEELGGEGLMLRQPSSKYEIGRSSTLLKVKTFHDADAKVLEYLPGTGKHKGRMGALSVELFDGTKFSVGTGFSDAQRENPPPIGSIITFRYQELSDRGVPRFPSFVRARNDMDTLTQSPLLTSQPITNSGSLAPETVPELGTSRASTVAASAVAISKKEDAVPKAKVDNDSTWRTFDFVEGDSNKFWKINTTGTDVTVRYGRIGTAGQEKTKSFSSETAAQKYAEEIIAEKTKKGYQEK